MPHVDLAHLNYMAIPCAALAAFFLGAIWYTALFGNAWKNAHGYTTEQLATMQKSRPMPVFFLLLIICYFAAAFTMALLLQAYTSPTLQTGIHVALLGWLLVTAFRGTAHFSSPRRISALLIDSGFDLVALLAMGAILGSWH